jgi:hypothetical protein
MSMKTYKIVHHHFRGNFSIFTEMKDNPLNNTMIFYIKGNQILFRFNNIEQINSTDKKIYIDKVEYNREFPQDIINLFTTLGMINTPTVLYLVYNPEFKVWFLKNNTFTTVFMIKDN